MTHRYSGCFLICTLLAFLTVPPLSLSLAGEAGDGAAGATILEDITITDRPIIQANQTDIYGSTKTVITQDQINDLNAQDLETALKMTPGAACPDTIPSDHSAVLTAAVSSSGAWVQAVRALKSKPWWTGRLCT